MVAVDFDACYANVGAGCCEPDGAVSAQCAYFENVCGAREASGKLEVFALGGRDGDVREAGFLGGVEGMLEGGWGGRCACEGVEVAERVGVDGCPAGVFFVGLAWLRHVDDAVGASGMEVSCWLVTPSECAN